MSMASEEIGRGMDAAEERRRRLLWHGGALGVLLVAAAALFFPTFRQMVAIWSHSETYTHGFAILPISLWLIWRRRDVLHWQTPAVDPLALPVLTGLGFAWLVGYYAGVNAMEQFAAVAMIPTAVWLTLGRGFVREWIFPLCFLLLAVPFGSFVVPPLMQFTADVTVYLVRLSGVPVYRDGLFFSLPSGNWSVVEACSGQRYLIASVTLGLLFAYLNYRSLTRRAAFVLASIIVPIMANGLRAYAIVMMGHLSGMKIAVGVDHLIYGWIFFGFVMALLFWIGGIWREPESASATRKERREPAGAQPPRPRKTRMRDIGLLTIALAIMALWPAWAKYAEAHAQTEPLTVKLPARVAGWSRTGDAPSWQPVYRALSQERSGVYANGGHTASLYIGRYDRQGADHELVMWGNGLVPPERRSLEQWRLRSQGTRMLHAPGAAPLEVGTAVLGRGEERLRVYFSYFVDGELTASPLGVKWRTLRARLLGHSDSGSVVAVAYPPDQATDAMQTFAVRAFRLAASTLRGGEGGRR